MGGACWIATCAAVWRSLATIHRGAGPAHFGALQHRRLAARQPHLTLTAATRLGLPSFKSCSSPSVTKSTLQGGRVAGQASMLERWRRVRSAGSPTASALRQRRVHTSVSQPFAAPKCRAPDDLQGHAAQQSVHVYVQLSGSSSAAIGSRHAELSRRLAASPTAAHIWCCLLLSASRLGGAGFQPVAALCAWCRHVLQPLQKAAHCTAGQWVVEAERE